MCIRDRARQNTIAESRIAGTWRWCNLGLEQSPARISWRHLYVRRTFLRGLTSCANRTRCLGITKKSLTSLRKYGHGPHGSDGVSEAIFFRWNGFCADLSGAVGRSWIFVLCCLEAPIGSPFFYKIATLTPKGRFSWFSSLFMAPFEEGQFGHRFHFLQLFKTF